MKTLKLQVGKTYRSRKGEEMRIVGKNDSIWPYVGNNEESYNEQGRYYSASWDSPYDLIEEVEEVEELPGTRHTFAIPDGAKEVTVEQIGNRIVVDMVPDVKEPKPGDVMVNAFGSVYIFKEVIDDHIHGHYAWLGTESRLAISGVCESGRPATPEEAQPLWDALEKAGKRWNPETMQVEDVPEIDRIREWVAKRLGDGRYDQEWIVQVISHYLKHKEDRK